MADIVQTAPRAMPWSGDIDLTLPTWLDRKELEATAELFGLSLKEAREFLFKENDDDPTEEGAGAPA